MVRAFAGDSTMTRLRMGPVSAARDLGAAFGLRFAVVFLAAVLATAALAVVFLAVVFAAVGFVAVGLALAAFVALFVAAGLALVVLFATAAFFVVAFAAGTAGSVVGMLILGTVLRFLVSVRSSCSQLAAPSP